LELGTRFRRRTARKFGNIARRGKRNASQLRRGERRGAKPNRREEEGQIPKQMNEETTRGCERLIKFNDSGANKSLRKIEGGEGARLRHMPRKAFALPH